jgi:hypothetical protein
MSLKIEIISIDRDKTIPVGTNEALGFRGHFRSPLVSGVAIFVPYSGRQEELVGGKTIWVETGQESVSNFMVVPSDDVPRIEALSEPGDYAVVGTTVTNIGDAQFDIVVGENLYFAVDNDETGGIVPKVGQRVSFTIHGLSLWGEGF